MISLSRFEVMSTLTSLSSILPAPKHAKQITKPTLKQEEETKPKKIIPPYGQRDRYIPRGIEDFGDGGAFPEIHLAQYPLNMGRKNNKTEHALVIKVDNEGKIQYDEIVKQGQRAGKIVFSKFSDTVGFTEDGDLSKPTENENDIIERTKQALQEKIGVRITGSIKSSTHNTINSTPESTYIRYTPGENQKKEHAAMGTQNRIIRMVQQQEDPCEPPKFRFRKLPRGPPSPPVPVMHSPPRKLTKEDMQNWKIPPCISNWKNPKGYTIPLDKRLAADGRGLQEVQINDGFAKLSEALYIAERTAREEIEKRAQYQKMISMRQREEREEKLRQLAQSARQARLESTKKDVESDSESSEDEEKKRDRIIEERRREREYERRRAKRKTKQKRDEDRDITEKIALGQPMKLNPDDNIDSRLFNYQSGLDSGFGSNEDYNLYDKPLLTGSSANQIYRPRKENIDQYNTDIDSILKNDRFKPAKEFTGGVDRNTTPRDGPVQFERVKDPESLKEEQDPFGLNKFLSSTKTTGKALEKIGKTGHMQVSAGGSRDLDSLRSSNKRTRINFESKGYENSNKRRK